MRLLREPLVHFIIFGAAIFALSQIVGRSNGSGVATPGDRQIIVTPERVALLKSGYVLDNGHDPTDAELQKLIDAYVREEVLVREARAQGLDADDSIIRRRLVQKMEFAVADPPAPADAVLADYLAQHPAAFRKSDGTVPGLSDIHNAVLAAWMNDQRKAESDQIYEKYRETYFVTVQMPATTSPAEAGKP